MMFNSMYSNYPQHNYSTPNNLIRVNGIDGARAYQMNPNSTVALFDNNEDVMYIKITDGAGFPTIRTFAFSEILGTRMEPSNYVSREEFENFKKEMMDYGKQSVSKSTKSKE